ncbi:MAG: membrane protein insertase YidC [Bacteroidales bacterium]|jgi:YidC/Oxa1 family membrane protein insertase|nr:membrane protein insertase YidC [Bacteroidales bacterium]MDD3100308.1 membrane protein insertase YidC [Bacteroidales bacterium]MDD3639121.1 membrane protein insertase YidC [Bacteroidales bacterium]MDD3943680.1 membrane protein insertase YidC [Bacteroidales bacterium]MDD4480432.1 membrane protein insertase YidC [Bacteroidales bacterium]
MNKNTIWAILLIGSILLGFSLYNSQVAKKKQREQFVRDSIAYSQAVEAARLQELQNPPAVVSEETQQVPVPALEGDGNGNRFANTLLNQSAEGSESFYVLENEKLKITFTNRGGQPYSLQIKNFKTYEGDSLYFFNGPENRLVLDLYAGEQINTGDFFFAPNVIEEGNTITFTLPFDNGSYIEYLYVLDRDSYLLNLRINLVGMDRIIPRNVTQLDLDWMLDIRHMEKGFDNEKNYSTIVYKYPNTKDVENLGLRKSDASETLKTRLEWVAFQQQFFSAILISDESFNSGDLSYRFYEPGNADSLLMNCHALVQIPYQASAEQSVPLQFYFGPNGYYALKAYDRSFEQIIPLGGFLIKWINQYLIIPIFNFLNRFISNFGLIILLMTIFIKLIISPFTFKSHMSSAKMRVLKPEIDKINAKYPKKDDAMKKQQETMALYKKTGVSVMGGCWPMLFQMPILFAMFRFFPGSIELRQEGFLWADDLSGYDSIFSLPFNIPLYGDHVSLFALLMAISMFLYSKMNMKQQPTNQQMPGMQGMMLYFMPLMMLVVANNLSAALSYYYLLSNLITMLQTWIIQKFFVNEEKLYRQLKEKAEKAPAVAKKSKFQQRLEQMQRQQQQQMKNRK